MARVRFSPARARWELEGRREARSTGDGGAVADITYGSWDWLGPEILRYRGEAEVLDPPALRAHVKETAQARLDEVLAAKAALA
jgi:predicted DNA-binding transcriptional regulator YafY